MGCTTSHQFALWMLQWLLCAATRPAFLSPDLKHTRATSATMDLFDSPTAVRGLNLTNTSVDIPDSLHFLIDSPPGGCLPLPGPCTGPTPFNAEALLASPDHGLCGGCGDTSALATSSRPLESIGGTATSGGGEGPEVSVEAALNFLASSSISLPQVVASIRRARDPPLHNGTQPSTCSAKSEHSIKGGHHARGDRSSNATIYQNLSSPAMLARLRSGITEEGQPHTIDKCSCRVSLGSKGKETSCHLEAFRRFVPTENEPLLSFEEGLAPWEVGFNQRVRSFMGLPQMDRGRQLLAILHGGFTKDRATGQMRMHYFVNEVEVCRVVFLMCYPVSKTVGRVVASVKEGNATLYLRDLEVRPAISIEQYAPHCN